VVVVKRAQSGGTAATKSHAARAGAHKCYQAKQALVKGPLAGRRMRGIRNTLYPGPPPRAARGEGGAGRVEAVRHVRSPVL